jgi:hypothetical protein
VDIKFVERIYREERLWLRWTKGKKIPHEGREGPGARSLPTSVGRSISPATRWPIAASSALPTSRTTAPGSDEPLSATDGVDGSRSWHRNMPLLGDIMTSLMRGAIHGTFYHHRHRSG